MMCRKKRTIERLLLGAFGHWPAIIALKLHTFEESQWKFQYNDMVGKFGTLVDFQLFEREFSHLSDHLYWASM